jgi:hypothetical protein
MNKEGSKTCSLGKSGGRRGRKEMKWEKEGERLMKQENIT